MYKVRGAVQLKNIVAVLFFVCASTLIILNHVNGILIFSFNPIYQLICCLNEAESHFQLVTMSIRAASCVMEMGERE